MVTTVGFTFPPLSTWQIVHSNRPECSFKKQLRSKKTGQLPHFHSALLCSDNFDNLTHNNCSQSQSIMILSYLTRCPTLISETLGDRLGENHLHLYWRDFHKGLGAGQSIFRCLSLRLQILFRDVVQKKKRENVGICPKWGTPPLPPVWE